MSLCSENVLCLTLLLQFSFFFFLFFCVETKSRNCWEFVTHKIWGWLSWFWYVIMHNTLHKDLPSDLMIESAVQRQVHQEAAKPRKYLLHTGNTCNCFQPLGLYFGFLFYIYHVDIRINKNGLSWKVNIIKEQIAF